MESTKTSTAPSGEAAASQQVFQIATGYIASTALYIAVRLRVADHVAERDSGVDELARATGANEDALYRILRLLASLGIFEETAPRRFAHTPASKILRSSQPGSVHDLMLWLPDPFHFRVYAEAMHSVMTGHPAVEKAVGAPVFEYFPRNPELSEVFNNAMTSFSALIVPAALDAYDFAGIDLIVDVAGGHGHVVGSILQRHPAMRGILFDLEHVIAGAATHLRNLGVEDRCELVTGDFFTAVPAGGDVYIMKHIIHDWDEERAETILRNIRSAMKPGGRVILLESVVLPGNVPDLGKLIDLEMLLMPGGRERTEAEFRTLFERAGFTLTRILPTQSPLSVIEAR